MSISEPATFVRETRCASCHGAVELECRAASGFWGYPEYHEYFCPRCGKQNHARTPGTILGARIPDGQHDAPPTRPVR
jgi:hypothetical protein